MALAAGMAGGRGLACGLHDLVLAVEMGTAEEKRKREKRARRERAPVPCVGERSAGKGAWGMKAGKERHREGRGSRLP